MTFGCVKVVSSILISLAALLPDVPPATVFRGRLVEERHGHGEEHRELGHWRTPGVELHSVVVVE